MLLLWLAERLVKVAFRRSSVSHVGVTVGEDGHTRTTLLPDFRLEDYRRAIRARPEAGLSKSMVPPMEKPPGRSDDLEALSLTLSN
jgi:hypothetical protein